MPSKRYAVCVTTFTMPVHLQGAYFVSFLLLTGRYYDAETSVILLLLDRAFTSYPFCKGLERSSFHQKFEETKGYSPGFFFSGSEEMC